MDVKQMSDEEIANLLEQLQEEALERIKAFKPKSYKAEIFLGGDAGTEQYFDSYDEAVMFAREYCVYWFPDQAECHRDSVQVQYTKRNSTRVIVRLYLAPNILRQYMPFHSLIGL